jgi:hypothetical protein
MGCSAIVPAKAHSYDITFRPEFRAMLKTCIRRGENKHGQNYRKLPCALLEILRYNSTHCGCALVHKNMC